MVQYIQGKPNMKGYGFTVTTNMPTHAACRQRSAVTATRPRLLPPLRCDLSHALPERCPHCQSGFLSWTTVRREGVFADQLDCETCGAVLGREDWHLPLEPTGPLICRNCGHKRSAGGVCGGCGLSEAEDRQVHQELAEMVAPGMGLLQACNQAADSGRRLLALKLATAAIQDSRRRDLARLMRISLLQDLGLLQAALGECGIWVREGGDHNPMACRHCRCRHPAPNGSGGCRGLRRNLCLRPREL